MVLNTTATIVFTFFLYLLLCKINEVHFLQRNENILEFKNFSNALPVPFLIVADWETFPQPIQTAQNFKSVPFTTNIAYHEPASFCYVIASIDPPLL